MILKVEGVLVMSYKQIFWTYWILMTVVAGLLILFLIFLVSNSYMICVSIYTRRESDSSARIYFALISIASLLFGSFFYVFGMLLINLYNYMDSNRRSAYKPLFHCIAIGWLVLMTLVIRLLAKWFASDNKGSASHYFDGVRGPRLLGE